MGRDPAGGSGVRGAHHRLHPCPVISAPPGSSRSSLSPPSPQASSRSSAHVLAALLALAAGGCLPALPQTETRPSPAFDPVVFFEGRTEGLGTLDVRGRAPEIVRVESVGTLGAGRVFEIRQLVRRGDHPASERTWVLRPDGPARYVGTLTDASGPVVAHTDGNRLRIRYSMGRGTTMTQDLTLEPGGRLALNLATVRFLGVPVARLTEQIRRIE